VHPETNGELGPRQQRAPLQRRALAAVDALSRQFGSCFATERYMRDALGRKGPRPGERSTSRVLRKAVREGLVRRVRVFRGGRLPSGRISNAGTTINVLISRQERRAAARARAKAKRRQAACVPRRVPRPSLPGPTPDVEQLTFEQYAAEHEAELPDFVRELVGAHGPAPPTHRK
jgi:hypothetical protein